MIRAAAALFLICAGPAVAFEFNMPVTARQTVARDTSPDVYQAPVGVFADGALPVLTIEGDVRRSAWRLDSPGLTPFQVMRPLREQLIAAGFEIRLDCQAINCGGFDFRFATETLPGPNMYVNIRAFQFVTGMSVIGDEVAEVVTLLASTSASSAYVQIIHAGATLDTEVAIEASVDEPVTSNADAPSEGGLLAKGHAVLVGLEFETGNAELGAGPFASLAELAAFLKAQPEQRIALVGHTDSVGGLDANIAISRARARSVRQRLIDSYNVAPDQMDAEGMGYLAPMASNLDAAGRDQNRRVEVVLLSKR